MLQKYQHDVDVYLQAKVLPAHIKVALARLRYLPRLLTSGSPLLLSLLELGGQYGGWLERVLEDFQWLNFLCPAQCSHLPTPVSFSYF